MSRLLPLKVINLWCGPGGGKSTAASGLFNIMKTKDHSVELVTEYAKDLTYEKNFGTLTNQLLILAEQDNRLRRLSGQVEWAITDSPLPVGLAYATPEYAFLEPTVWSAYDRYRNYNILLERGDRRFQEYGRNQTHEEAKKLGIVIGHLFDKASEGDEDFTLEVASEFNVEHRIYEWLMAEEEAMP